MAQTGNINQAVCEKRKEKDVVRLLMSDYQVKQNPDTPHDFWVTFQGPKDSLYEGGTWNVHVLLPDQYPYRSPSIGFSNKIYHPNIDEYSGSICLDVINQTWSPMFDLINIFEVFLPQLLLYPNPSDPLNAEAAGLYTKDQNGYKKKVKDYVLKHACKGQKIESAESIQSDTNSETEKQTSSNETTPEKKGQDDEMEEEISEDDEDDKMSYISNVSELSATSQISLIEEC